MTSTSQVPFNPTELITGSRVPVQRSIADAYPKRLVELLEQVVLGPADSESSRMGLLIDHAAVDRVEGIVKAAARYAKVLVSGGRT